MGRKYKKSKSKENVLFTLSVQTIRPALRIDKVSHGSVSKDDSWSLHPGSAEEGTANARARYFAMHKDKPAIVGNILPCVCCYHAYLVCHRMYLAILNTCITSLPFNLVIT